MDVSFIIPLYNRFELTRTCIESLQASLPDGLTREIILVDDGSTDGTREWLATLPSPPFRILLNDTRSGYARNNNRGARQARGRFLALLNNDLEFAPGWLEPMLAAFARHRRVGLVGNIQLRVDSGRLDHAGVFINLKGKPEHIDGTRHPVLRLRPYTRQLAVTGACCVIERDRFLDFGGFDERYLNGAEDIDLCFRLRERGYTILTANRSVVRHHVSASPGRKDHDERNTRLLFWRWRDRLVLDGAAYWPLAYLQEHWPDRHHADHRLLWQALSRLLRLTRRPAPHALSLLDKNIAIEEARWEAMFGPMTEAIP